MPWVVFESVRRIRFTALRQSRRTEKQDEQICKNKITENIKEEKTAIQNAAHSEELKVLVNGGC